MTPAQHLLVAEDDPHIREGLVDLLESEGFRVSAAADGRQALTLWQGGRFDLVILDVMMPGRSGYDVCREIRRRDTATPVVMLTAKGEEIDKVVGLELGADDYITKPFGVRELVARVHAVLRRARPAGADTGGKDEETDEPPTFRFGEALIHRHALRGELRGAPFDLTPRELQLLEYFAARPGMVLSREKLLQAVWGYPHSVTTRTVDQHIAQLRKKVEPDPGNPVALTTAHGAGYRYEPPLEA